MKLIKNETKNMGKSTELEEKCENGLMIADYCGKVKDDYSQNKEANPLLVQRNSDFAPQNKEDWL